MTKLKSTIAIGLAIVGTLAGPLLFGQEAAPEQAFKAVHLVTLPAGVTEGAYLAALTDLNQAIVKGGCPTCVYHLYKVFGQKKGDYVYMRESAWPGRTVYDKVHAAPEYVAVDKKHPELGDVAKQEVYNRYVEVKATKK